MFDAALAAARAGATTPVWLRRSLVAVVLAALLAGGVALWAAASISGTARTIGQDTEPSVSLALRMAAALSNMNAAALSDSLTEGGAAAGTSEPFRAAEQALTDDLVEAARNVTYGDAEAGPLRELQHWLLAYQTAVVEARGAVGNAWVAQHRVEWASRVNRDFAAPAATALAKANVDQLEARYAAYRSGSVVFAAAAGGAFGLLVMVLGAVQVWLAGRVRRLVNPLLAAATVMAVLAGVWFVVSALQEREDLRAAKSDAYDSLLVLFEAKGAASELRAEMSAWLLDPALRSQAQAGMNATVRRLVEADLDAPGAAAGLVQRLNQALGTERAGDPGRALTQVRHPGGLLGREMDNVTYGVDERRPASESLMWLIEVRRLILQVQQAAAPRPGDAVRMWVGDEPGQGGAAFQAMQAALDETIRVNQVEFDRHVAAALGASAWLPWGVVGALLLTVLLAAGGLWQRLREYR